MSKNLPTAPGAVVNVDGDRALLTKFGNWVTEGVFVIGPAAMEEENFVVEYDPDEGCAFCSHLDRGDL
jgi:hypothetical protein